MRSAPDVLPRSPPSPQLELPGCLGGAPGHAPKPPRLDWATLQARTFGTDVWVCPCGGRRRVVGLVTSPTTAQDVLHRLGLLEPPRTFCPHGPALPQLLLPL